MGFSNWFRGLRNQPNKIMSSFFYQLGGAFAADNIEDKVAVSNGYMGSEKWYSISKKAAEVSAGLPYRLVIERENGEDEVVTSGDLYDKIFNPNEEQSLKELFEEQLIYYFTTGDSYFYSPIESIGYTSNSIIGLPPQLVTANMVTEGSVLSKIKSYTLEDLQSINILPEEMLHVRMTNPSVNGILNREGLSPLNAGYNKLKASNNSSVALASYFENRGVANLISANPTAANSGLTMTSTDKQSLQQGLKEQLGGAHRMNGNYVTKSAVTVNQLGASSSDMQMVDNDIQLLRSLANLIGMPSVLFNDPQNSTWSNWKEAVKTMYNDVAIPSGQKFVDGYNRSIVKEFREREGIEYKLKIFKEEIDALKPSRDEVERSISDQVKQGIISRQEARIKLGMEQYEGAGKEEMDIPTIQTNQIPISDASNKIN
jgi:HK97 family phage portal protein